jgi:DNA-binding CsgD family transcriptional regulator
LAGLSRARRGRSLARSFGDSSGREKLIQLIATDSVTLLERDRELELVRALLTGVRNGQGGALVLESPAGTGKSALLEAAAKMARDEGVDVLAATALQLERESSFDLARQLLDRVLADPDPRLFDGPGGLARRVLDVAADPASSLASDAAIHGLFWLCLNLSGLAPTLLVVDDAHWADPPSWRWLNYLSRRLDGLPLGLLIAGLSEVSRLGGPRPAEIAHARSESPIELGPLSVAGVRRLIAIHLSRDAEPEFADACYQLTRGNPFLVVELLRAVKADVLKPVKGSIGQLGALSLDRIGWSVRARLELLGAQAAAMAEALAVLEQASLSELTALSGVDTESATATVDLLIGVGLVVEGPRFSFTHPIVRNVIYDGVGPARRSALHRRAAAAIDSQHGPLSRVASHLMQIPPDAEEWVARRLLAAAAQARSRGGLTAVTAYLTRAAAERTAPDLRAEVLAELGLAQEQLGGSECIERLEEAISLARDDPRLAELTRALSRALFLTGRVADAVDRLEHAIGRLGTDQPELVMGLEMEIQAMARTVPACASRADDRLAALVQRSQREAEIRPWIDQLSVQLPCWRAGDWRVSARRARDHLERDPSPLATEPQAIGHYSCVQALTWCCLYDEALAHLESALRAASDQGSFTGHALACTYRAEAHVQRGTFREAEEDARAAIDMLEEQHLHGPAALAYAWLAKALLEQARCDEAWEVLRARHLDQRMPEQSIFATLHETRACLHLAGGQPALALEDALHAGELLAPLGPGPAPLAWRSTAALAASALGEAGLARELAKEELGLARAFGAARPLGIALRTSALVSADEALERLRESVRVLEGSQARAQLARSLLELGTALRRGRAPIEEPRAVFRRALDLAHDCGAGLIAGRARDELVASGLKPRRSALHGREALTGRELRVAELAAGGATNRQIAGTLFLSPRTVEHHLRSIYRKLRIESRDGLVDALRRS